MKITSKIRFFMLMMLLVPSLNSIPAQESVIVSDSVFSKILNEERGIRILLPGEYKTSSDTKYDVVYLLDGEVHFDIFSFVSKFAGSEKILPPVILVALPNMYINGGNTRDRDFLPENTINNKKTGGADNFIAFLKNELIPYINQKYSTSGDNSLFGHSLSGLFTMYVLLKEPDLFTTYYCSDPAFPWNNRRIIEMTKEKFKNTNELNKILWINGVENTYRNVGIQEMDSVLKAYAPKGLRWKVSVYDNETHMSVRLKGIYDGLKYAYDGYNSKKQVEFHANNGSLLKGKPAPVFLNGSFPNVYYTTDGTEPDTLSKLAPQMIEISAPATLKVKWIGENKKYITTSKGNFELSEIWPSLQFVKDMKSGGLRYSYYEGKWKSIPDFTILTAVKTGIADSSFSLEKLPAKSDFGCVFDGFIKIDTEGYYAFALCSSDGSKLYINNREIINNDGLHSSDWYKSYVVPLQKGYYPIRIEYFKGTGEHNLNLIYITPDNHETVNLRFGMMYFR